MSRKYALLYLCVIKVNNVREFFERFIVLVQDHDESRPQVGRFFTLRTRVNGRIQGKS